MTATQQFIEDAIKGGWKSDCKGIFVWANKVTHTGTTGFNEQSLTFYEILLDPLAWQAVGKTRGWFKYTAEFSGNSEDSTLTSSLQYRMHSFIDHLIDGKSIEDALTAITN